MHNPESIDLSEAAEVFTGHILVTFKFGGSWVSIKNQTRQIYKGGKQKTVRIDKSNLNLFKVKSEVEKICHWVRGHNFDLYYHLRGSSPKEYKLLGGDFEVAELINQSNQNYKSEIVVITPGEVNDHTTLDRMNEQPRYDGVLVTNSQAQNHIDETICVGSRFCSGNHFKQILRRQAIVETESKNTWSWFLQNLLTAFDSELHSVAFISDMEKGLGEAIRTVFPNAEHRVCVRHLWKNMKKQFRYQEGHKIQNLFWAASNTYNKNEYDIKMEEINALNPRVHSYLMSLPFMWSRSQFSTEFKSSTTTNNMSESFNSWIATARGKPAVDLVDTIRGMLMDQRAKRKMNSSNWNGELVPHAEEYIREVTTRREQFIVRHGTMFRAEVEGCHERHEVDIQNHECTCRVWQVSGLPCIHAVSLICNLQHPLWHTYISEHFYVSRYKLAYDGVISTMPEKQSWTFVQDDRQVGVPNTSRPRGRPRKKRLRSFLEDNSYGKRNKHKCSRCGLSGHHRSSCKNPLNQTTQTSS